MKKKLLIVFLILLLIILIPFLIKKEKKVEKKEKTVERLKINYLIEVLNISIKGETYCYENEKLRDVLNRIRFDVSRKVKKYVPMTFDAEEKKLKCFLNVCGDWKIFLNGKEVDLGESCKGGELIIRFKPLEI